MLFVSVVYLLLAVLYGWWAAKVVCYSAATQYWGQRLANTRVVLQELYDDEELNGTVKKANLFGFQKIITCKVQRLKSVLRFLGNIPFFIIGVILLPWYMPILGVLLILNVKYYFLNRDEPPHSHLLLEIVLKDLQKELKDLQDSGKITAIEEKERKFFIRQLKLILNVNLEIENSSVYRYKEILELREKDGTAKLNV
ncbi:MAG: hypothetical protein ACK5IJ_01185 [Mangrovibacterium sp.]